MDEHEPTEVMVDEAVAGVAGAAAAIAAVHEDLQPVRHQLRIALGGAETRAPQFFYRAVTLVNPTAQDVWFSALAGEAASGRDGAGGMATRVPAGASVTEPILGRELYVAGAGSGMGLVTAYRWPMVQPFRIEHLASGGGGGGGGAITSVVPGTAATNLGKAEDSAAASGDVGVMALAVRQDTLAASVGADGDYAWLKLDDQGLLRVRVDGLVQLSALSDSISAAPDTSRVMAGNTALAVGRANVALSADGTLIAAQGAGNRIQIHALDISNPGGATFQIDDGAAGTRMLGPYSESRIVPFSPVPWAQGTANTLAHFNITAGAGTVGITAIYSVTV